MKQILDLYNRIPYHNRAHARDTEVYLWRMDLRSKSQLLAAFGHDAGHTGTPTVWDEARSAIIATTCARIYDILKNPSEFRETESMILWTVFKNRVSLTGNQLFLADADVAAVGDSFAIHTKNAARLFIEHCFSKWKVHPSRKDVLDFWSISQEGFYKYLTDITGNLDRPFLTEKAQELYPKFPHIRDQVRETLLKNPKKLIDIVRKEWLLFWERPLILEEEL